MRTNLLRRAALLACISMTASCAGLRPALTDAPRLSLPEIAERPCELPLIPDEPTTADLEAAYAQRGAAIVKCDAARQLAIDTLTAERSIIDQWLKQRQR